MSFGKKTPKSRDSESFAQTGKFDPEQTFDASNKASNFEFFALAGTLVGFVFAVSVVLLWWFGGGSSTPAAALASNAHLFSDEPEPVARNYTKRPPSVFGFDIRSGQVMSIKVVTTDNGFDAIDSELHERCLRGIDEARAALAESIGKTYLTAQDAEEFISCSMTVYTRRFCDPFYQARIVKRLQRFERLRAETIRIANTSLGRAYDHIANNIEGTNPDVDFGSSYNPNIVSMSLRDALRNLTERGILKTEHFGWVPGVPDGLKPFVAESKFDACNGDQESWFQSLFG